jgi:predicted heme/steroid binding protein
MAPKPEEVAAIPESTVSKKKSSSSKTMDGFREYAYEEIAATDGDFSQFLTVIRGQVYDLREFWLRHPGGTDVIRLAAGRDSSVLFESYHPLSAQKRLEQYKVGVCVDPKVPSQQDDAFWVTLRQRVEDYLKQNKTTRQLTWMSLFELVATLVASVAFWYMSAMNKSWLGAVLLGFCYARLGYAHHIFHFRICE